AVEVSFPDLAIDKFRRTASGGASQVMALCAACHGIQGREVAQDALAVTVRFQGTTLTWSKCFEMSQGTFHCLTCHSAHDSAVETPAFYEAKCLSCHAGESYVIEGRSRAVSSGLDTARSVTCPVNPRHDCLACHMPKVPSIVPHSAFTD